MIKEKQKIAVPINMFAVYKEADYIFLKMHSDYVTF